MTGAQLQAPHSALQTSSPARPSQTMQTPTKTRLLPALRLSNSTARPHHPTTSSRRTGSTSLPGEVFGQNRPPRWLLLLSFSQLVLIERGKWAHSRLLRFDFEEMLGRAQRAEDATLKATAALLHRSSLLPGEGAQSLLDGLDENSHRHAFAVSTDLKYAMRESIERIGNEAIRYLREVSHERVYNLDDQLADKLGLECVRYMYRLLFLFYIEARPELGYAPLNSDAYRAGYSLERLRDLELVELATEESRNGFHLHGSIESDPNAPRFTNGQDNICQATTARARFLKAIFDLPMDIKYALPGGRVPTMQQLERNDIQARGAGMWYTLARDRPGWQTDDTGGNGPDSFLQIFFNGTLPELQLRHNGEIDVPEDTPQIIDLMTEEQEAVWRILSIPNSSLYRASFAPPGTPDELVKILRDAMEQMVQDPEFLADYAKILSGDEVTPTPGRGNDEAIRGRPGQRGVYRRYL